MSFELPPRACFKYCVPLYPKPQHLPLDGHLHGWTTDYLLPDFTALDGGSGYAQLYAAWDVDGLYFAVRVPERKRIAVNPRQEQSSGRVFVWIDTRDARDIQRGTRFCRAIQFYPNGAGPHQQAPAVREGVLIQPTQTAPPFDPAEVQIASQLSKTGYQLEAHVPTSVLPGYAPGECARLGLYLQVIDREFGEQFWPYPAPFPFWENPSLWAAIELLPS